VRGETKRAALAPPRAPSAHPPPHTHTRAPTGSLSQVGDDAAWNDDKSVLGAFEQNAGAIATKIKTLQQQQVMAAVAALGKDSPSALIQAVLDLVTGAAKDDSGAPLIPDAAQKQAISALRQGIVFIKK
jgi:uncharacterized membrane protein